MVTTTLSNAITVSQKEDSPLSTNHSSNSAGELRFFGITEITYESFVGMLVIVVIFFALIKIILKRHYKKHGYPKK